MAVLGRILFSSSERLDLPDLLSIDSFTSGDFKYLIQSFVGSETPYILTGFDVISPESSIGTESVSIRVADSVVYAPTQDAGSFYYGLPEGNANSLPIVPELRKNATNFVYLRFSSTDTVQDSRAFWDPDANGGEGGEFSQDINTESLLTVEVDVSTSTFPEGTIPIAKVVVGSSVIEEITDSRDMLFRLGTGGVSPDPFSTYDFRQEPSASYARSEPSSTMTSSSDPNAFQGGDKNFRSFKEWMDVVMTQFKEVKGTTFWYEGASSGGSTPPNLKNTWLDALGSTLKSKGQWEHSGSVAGRVEWSEDIQYVSLVDPRISILRAGQLDISSDNSVAYLKLIRDADINPTATAVDWVNSTDNVNGAVGAFQNLAQGDWIKKVSDGDERYLRVEQFYSLPNQAGGTTTAALAQSIKLSDIYAGTTGSEVSVYTQGEYLQTDVNIVSTDDPQLQIDGGNVFWIAYRSDTVQNVASIATTTLSLDIEDADGQQARCIAAGHGLNDGDRITISTGSYVGTYQVEVENANEFFIRTAITGDESGVTARYAIVTTASRSTDDGYLLESANHNFESHQTVTISGTATAFDGTHVINERNATQVQIPIGVLIPGPVSVGEIALARVNVRTEFGTVKVVQGESIDIGESESENIMDFIGMKSLAQSVPDYNTPLGYNALDGYQNYNSSAADNLTERAAKLTAMMADRVQERGLFFKGRVSITSTTNSTIQEIRASDTILAVKPGSPDQEIDLTADLPENSAAIAEIDRDGDGAISLTIESLGSDHLLGENKLIMFYRFTGTDVYDWNGSLIQTNGGVNTNFPEDSQNRNITFHIPGNAQFDPSTGAITLDMPRISELSEITTLDGASTANNSYWLLGSANDATLYYVWYNVDAAGVDPAIGGRTGIEVAISSGDTAADVALATATAIDLIADFNSTSVDDVVRVDNADPGPSTDVDDGAVTTNFIFETVCQGISPEPEIIIPGSVNPNTIEADVINGLGTLILSEGQSAWVRIDRSAAKTFNVIETDPDTADSSAAGAIYITNTADVRYDQNVIVLFTRVDGGLIQHHKGDKPDGNVYDELVTVVAGLPGVNEVSGPVIPGTRITLPLDSRDNDTAQEYIVGSGQLEIYLNGQYLILGEDWDEVGDPGCLSNRIEILQELVVDDRLMFRIDAHGAVYFAGSGASSGGSTLQSAYDGGRTITTNPGQPVVVSGPPGEKLFIFQGDIDVTGVIDPTALQLTPEPSNPMAGGQRGIWVNNSNKLIFEDGTINVNLVDDFLRVDGTSPMIADLNLDGNKLINVGTPTNPGDAVSKGYGDATYIKLDGTSPFTANLDAGTNTIANLSAPVNPQDAATKGYVDAADLLLLPLDGSRAMTGALNMGSQLINNVLDPVGAQDAATKAYVDTQITLTGASAVIKTNAEAFTINAGDIVIGHSNPDEVLVANASSVATGATVIGVAAENIAPGATGAIKLTGETSVNTTGALVPGQFVYLSTTNGQATSTPPTSIGSVSTLIGVAATTTEVVLNIMYRFENENSYEEPLTVVAGAPADDNEITGPITSGTNLTLPLDGRNSNAARTYVVGDGDLEVYLNGQKLILDLDYSEVGSGTSNQIQILRDLVVDDIVLFRDGARTTNLVTGGGGGGGAFNDLTDVVVPAPSIGDTVRWNGSAWINVPDNLGDINTASNVGAGDGQLFKQVTGDDIELRTIIGGTGINVSTGTDEITITRSLVSSYFVDYIALKGRATLPLSAEYSMHTDAIDLYRNGVMMFHSPFLGNAVDQFMESTRNTLHVSVPGDADEYFVAQNNDQEPSFKILFANIGGDTVISLPSYTQGDDSLRVYRNGVLMNAQALGEAITQYAETSSTSITLAEAALPNDVFIIVSMAAPSFRNDITGISGTNLNIGDNYTVGDDSLMVFKNGILQTNNNKATVGDTDNQYVEDGAGTSSSVTLQEAAVVEDIFTFIIK